MSIFSISLFFVSLTLGSTITLFSNHWLLAWLGLEINALAIIPLMVKTPHPRSIEAATKYFLVQAIASALLIFACTLNLWLTGEWAIFPALENIPSILLSIALLMKLGIAPFHFWMPDVLQGLTLLTGLILSTWMKLPPAILMYQFNDTLNLSLLLTTGLISTILGGWGGINQTQIRKFLAFSSIAQLGWMTAVLKLSPNLALFNFTIYILLTSTLFLIFIDLNSGSLLKLMSSWTKFPALGSLTALTLLSISGLPPLTGFTPKWLIIKEMLSQEFMFIALLMLLFSLLSLFYYLRFTYTMMTLCPQMSYSTTPWTHHLKTLVGTLFALSILLAPMLPLICS
uniref:NADH-ubiquinone oxidoreductase chain 2 n=1 Tax=Craugastor longirostris TaxID=228434 RepID=Q53EE2_9NEOB|nr:NADH dehydrogenase subunit II [Craugastor longirostris]